ncbi:MAG: hypothetical protein ACM3WU_07680 [Bacillota bacterium]
MRRVRITILGASVIVLVAAILVFAFPPEPELSGWFGLTPAPQTSSMAFGSVDVTFSGLLRSLVVLRDIGFVDESSTYSLDNAWVNVGKGGGAFFAESVEDLGPGFDLVQPNNYRVHNARVSLLLGLRVENSVHTGDRPEAGPNRLILTYSVAGRVLTRHIVWDPND